jgi:hypothetical protein
MPLELEWAFRARPSGRETRLKLIGDGSIGGTREFSAVPFYLSGRPGGRWGAQDLERCSERGGRYGAIGTFNYRGPEPLILFKHLGESNILIDSSQYIIFWCDSECLVPMA